MNSVPEAQRLASELSDEATVWSSFARSVRDNAMAELGIQTIRVSAMIVLARALRPENFGVFKILLIVGTIGILVYEAGIPDSLIRLKDLRATHESTAWCMSISLAIASAALLWFAAPLVAIAMKMPALKLGARLLCIPILLEGSIAIANARLQRSLRFGALALADLLGEIVFLGVALGVVWKGVPTWSLPLALAARLTTHALTIWIADPRPPVGVPRLKAARELLRFATTVSGGQVLYFLSSNADFLLVGRLLGSTALGFYVIAWDLLRFVPDRLHQVAGRVTYPAFCKLQDDNQALSRAYLGFFEHLAKIVLPVLAVVAIVAPELVLSVYGRQWLAAAQPLRLLAAGLTLAGMRVGIGSLFYSKGYPSLDIYLHTFRLLLIIAAVSTCARYGLIGVSAAMSLVEGIVSIVGIYVASCLIDLRAVRLIRAALPGLRVAAICMICASLAKQVALGAGLQGPIVLLPVMLICVLAYCLLEAQTMMRMLSAAFGRSSLAPLDT
jgi:O-antigen/teichoic acid export membrane protein